MKEILDLLSNFYEICFFWVAVIVTVLALIFRDKDKKEDNNLYLYDWFIAGGLCNILGMRWLTLIIYGVCSLIWAIKIKIQNKTNGSSKTSDNVIIIYSLISIVLIIFMFVNNM